ncbi:Membrane-associated phospholipid phosphatase [Devosia sp. YR412]|uniref:phosphatase PAP2 family protein n=1 Tax=Devosia sp. YR412 TaxID=1881030 RepID=UPI0008D89C7C|nr:phosphatase PAP2 family protein [Devosia sp. YR412]SEQ57938.1 Membrane-associated phospholipid phosphatase [Devosia sp. YR412]
MPNLTQRWPLGLNRKNWPDFTAAMIALLFVLVFFDVYVSQTLMAWPDVWKAPFAFITDFGLSDWVLIPSLIIFVVAAIAVRLVRPGLYRRATYELALVASFIFIGVGLPGLGVNLLKRLFGRARPELFIDSGHFQFQHFLNDWSFQSFPSGHATTAIGTAFIIGFMAPRYFRLILLIAVMTGISRVVIGMHYPTDVVAGFVVGMLGAYAIRNLYATRRWLFAELPDRTVRFRGAPNLKKVWRRMFQRAAA